MFPSLTQRSRAVLQTKAKDPQQPKSAWEYYLDMARIDDVEQERELTEQVDIQLVFAGLFAAFLSAFLMATLRYLEEDTSATLLDVVIYQTQMMRNQTLPPYHREPFTPSPQIVAVNGLLFASLTLILGVAFISMLVKGWIREFDRGLAAIAKPRRRALVREYRYLGLERYKFVELVHFLPALIYLSLLLFFCGLSLFLFKIEAACGCVVAAIFALGALFYITTIIIATIDDSAPFRSSLSHALGCQFRRLSLLLLDGTTLWRACLRRAVNADHPNFIRALFYRLARMARWKPFSEADFPHQDGSPVLDEQTINVADAAIERLYKFLPHEGIPGELYRSIVIAGDPAHVLGYLRSASLIQGCARSSDEMSPEERRAVGLLICRSDQPYYTMRSMDKFADKHLPVLAKSNQAWDRLLACLTQSLLPKGHGAFRSLHSSTDQVLEAIRIMEMLPNRMLLIVRFLGSTVSRTAEPKEKVAAVRILSTVLSQLLSSPFSSSLDQLVDAIIYVFFVINDVPFPGTNPISPLSKFPSFPCIAYDPGVLSRVITPTQWRSQDASVTPACRKFRCTLIAWIWHESAFDPLLSRILRELPRTQLEECARDPPSDSYISLPLAYLLLEAMISDSEIPRSEFPALDDNNSHLEEVLALYDSYLIRCNAMPSLHLQNLLSPREGTYLLPDATHEVRHPWLALHTYTLTRKQIPHALIPALKWSDTPALEMIARDRLKLYEDLSDGLPVLPEPALFSLFLSSTTYETVLKVFKWHLDLTTRPYYMHQEQYYELTTNLPFDKIIPILFGSTLDENQIKSSWTLVLDSLVLPWPCLPNEMRSGFVREFFRPQIDMRNSSSNQNTCLGIAWFEQLWTTVLAPVAGSVCIENIVFAQDHCDSFDRNTGWSGPVDIKPEEEWLIPSINKRKKKRRQEQRLERARRSGLLCSVDEVLPVLAVLLKAAHEVGLLSVKAVAHLQASPLLSHPRLRQDAGPLQVIEALIECYRPCLCPLPEDAHDEAEMPFDTQANDPTI